jgi:hypothetical protein
MEKRRMAQTDDLPPPIYQLLELLAGKPLVRLNNIVEAGLLNAFWAALPLGLLEVEKSAGWRLQAALKHVCYHKLPDSFNTACWLSQEGRQRLELHQLWRTDEGDPTASRQVDKKKDTAEKLKKSYPRNLKVLKDIKRKVRRDKQHGMTQEQSVREYVEEHYPKLTSEEQILKQCNNLIRYMSRYKHLLKSSR